jgi:hypothetical protein
MLLVLLLAEPVSGWRELSGGMERPAPLFEILIHNFSAREETRKRFFVLSLAVTH